jgi:hypothetical protein
MQNILILLCFSFCCCIGCFETNSDEQQISDTKWTMCSFLFQKQVDDTSDECLENSRIFRLSECNTYFVTDSTITVPNLLAMEVETIDTHKKGNDTLFVFCNLKYQNTCILPTCGRLPEAIVFINKQPILGFIHRTYLYHRTKSNDFHKYLVANADVIHPWLRQEAQRRGILK